MNRPDVTLAEGDLADLEAVMRVMNDSFDRAVRRSLDRARNAPACCRCPASG